VKPSQVSFPVLLQVLLRVLIPVFVLLASVDRALGVPSDDQKYYRNLTLNLRKSGEFQVPTPDHKGAAVKYEMEFGEPVYAMPIMSDVFWDRILLKDGSHLDVGGEQIPLTCVFIRGRDNRNTTTNPNIPKIYLQVYIVANDYTCQGPIRPDWPASGGRKESWDTYLYYEIRDPTIMLPVDAHIRYRWGETPIVLNDHGTEARVNHE
jgi:hypothetical protein